MEMVPNWNLIEQKTQEKYFSHVLAILLDALYLITFAKQCISLMMLLVDYLSTASRRVFLRF